MLFSTLFCGEVSFICSGLYLPSDDQQGEGMCVFYFEVTADWQGRGLKLMEGAPMSPSTSEYLSSLLF